MPAPRFPQEQLEYADLSLINTWGVAALQKYSLGLQLLEIARTYVECHYPWIAEALENDDEKVFVKAFDTHVATLKANGWGEVADSALHHALRDYGPMQKALAKRFPEAGKRDAKAVVKAFVKNCRP